ncbi:MAG: hypothetical protein ACT443_05205 [Gemmatimonadota bacterium]
MTSMAVKVATGGALALIGLVVVKFVLGLVVGVVGLTMFMLFKVLPIVLIAALVIWLFKKATRSGSTA